METQFLTSKVIKQVSVLLGIKLQMCVFFFFDRNYWWTYRLSSVVSLFFCVSSNFKCQMIKETLLSLIHQKTRKHTSFPQSFRDFKI